MSRRRFLLIQDVVSSSYTLKMDFVEIGTVDTQRLSYIDAGEGVHIETSPFV